MFRSVVYAIAALLGSTARPSPLPMVLWNDAGPDHRPRRFKRNRRAAQAKRRSKGRR